MGLTTESQDVPVRIVGSSVYGRFPTISVERTYNMYISSSADGEEQWLISFPGYAAIQALISAGAEGRGFFRSVRGGFVLAVVGSTVFRLNVLDENPTSLGTIGTNTGEVFFDENLSAQIMFVDGQVGYIYNYVANAAAFEAAVYKNISSPTTNFLPNYVSYHNTYFLIGNSLTTTFGSQWIIFEQDTSDSAYSLNWVQTLSIQTKPDFALAVLRIPGRGNNVIVFGSTVAEIWNNIGGAGVYQRQSSINIDYGCASVATIAANDDLVAWLGINEKSSASLQVMQGGAAERISNDGLDHLLETVKFPSQSTAMLYREGGHLFYILSFLNVADNFSIMYDFTTKRIYDLTDWDGTAFPARQMIFFQNGNYFLSYKDGSINQISSDLTTYNTFAPTPGSLVSRIYDIPFRRLTNTYRIDGRPEKYKIKMFTFVIESGTTDNAFAQQVCEGYIITEQTETIIYTEDNLPLLVEDGYCWINLPRVDLTISKNGGLTFSNTVSYTLKPTGDFKNQPRFNNLGFAQQITYQLRFWGQGRFVVKNGTMEISE